MSARTWLVGCCLTLGLSGAVFGCSGEPVRLGLALPALRAPCVLDKLEATLRFPGQDKTCKLERRDGAFRGTCEGIVVGDKLRVVLEYTQPPLTSILAKVDKVVSLQVVDGRAKLELGEADLVFDDDDSDGMANLDEVCVGRDPAVADSPSFSDVVGESGAPGSVRAIGEKVRIIGAAIPKAELLTVKLGPFLGKPKDELQAVTPTSVGPSAIGLVIPAGVDTSAGKLTVEIEVWGQKTTLSVPIVRLWASASRAVAALAINSSNRYAPPFPLEDYSSVDLDASCVFCEVRLWDRSADGRLLLGQIMTLNSRVFVVDWVLRKAWAAPVSASLAGALLFGDHIIVVSPDGKQLESRPLNRAQQRIDGVVSSLPVSFALRLVRGRAGSNRFYVISADGLSHKLASYRVDLTTGALSATGKSRVLAGTCGLICPLSAAELDAERVFVARAGDVDQVLLVDLDAGTETGEPAKAPAAVVMTYGANPTLHVVELDDEAVLKKNEVSLCSYDATTFGNSKANCVDPGAKATTAWLRASAEGDTLLLSVAGSNFDSSIYPFDLTSRTFLGKHNIVGGAGDVMTQP
jgi:hypothetical protein